MVAPEFHLFLPQLRMTLDQLVERAHAAEAAGFDGVALMDHLVPPGAEDKPMYEAMTAATVLALRTERLTVGHLVLCDAFREPAVLARQAVTIDHASGGRFELGIGAGSVPGELETFGIGPVERRVSRLGETLEVLTRLWSGETVDHDGEFHRLRGARQLPVPTRRIPIVIGGTGPRMMELVSSYADWWNLPTDKGHRLEELRPAAGRARTSMQQIVGFIPDETRREEVTALTKRRFGWMAGPGPAVGTGAELVEHFGALRDRGVERVYTWFTDFAPPETLAAFGADVIGAL
jgi:alkanesulfonate monooxygenase SsuD/methylene tetrahydromethanopterin reductase-like flavin-dependent oxidoreductase (luciferase family)